MALTHDIRYAFRTARLNPLFTGAVTLTLALCIGANTAIFSVIDATLLRPLPYPEPDRLMQLVTIGRSNGVERMNEAQDGRTWEAFRDHATMIDVAVSSGGSGGVNLSLGGNASFVQQQRVSAGFFRVLGVAPLMGREFNAEEDRPGGPPVAILSHRLWVTALGSDPSVIGKTLMLRGEPHSIVGVMASGAEAGGRIDVWTPLRPTRTGEGGGSNFTVIARLKPGIGLAQANGEAESIGAGVYAERKVPAGVTMRLNLISLQRGQTGGLRQPLLLLWTAVALVVLIGCVNIAGMLLARGSARAKEIATRIALGGGRAVIMRQMLSEYLVLGVFGGVAGIALGWLALKAMQAAAADSFGFLRDVRLDARVLAATGITVLLTTLIFGLYPAWQVSRVDIRSAQGTRGVSRQRSFRSLMLLVAGQIALAVPMLIGAGLLVRTLTHLLNVPPGFDPENVITASFSLQDARYGEANAVNRLFDQTLSRMKEVPGVESAAVALTIPFDRPLNTPFRMPGAPKDRREITNLTYVSPEYFEALRIPLRRGRLLTRADNEKSAPVVVLNEAFVKRYFDKQDPLGAVLDFGNDARMVVGVVASVQHRPGFGGNYGPLDAVPGAYVTAAQTGSALFKLVHTWFSPSWIVRSSRPAADVQRAVEAVTRSVDPLLPLATFRTLDEVKMRNLGWQRFMASLLSLLAGLAVVLATVGVYSMIANSVVERTRELGIRMAIGATVREAVLSAARPGMIPALAGITAGCVLAQFGVKLLDRMIWGVRPTDVSTYAAVIGGVLVLAGLASLIPSLRISRLNPADTLRQE